MPNVFDPHMLAYIAIAIVILALITRSRNGKAAHGCPKHLHGKHRNGGSVGASGATLDDTATVLNRVGRITSGLFRLAMRAAAVGLIGAILWYWFGYLRLSFPG